MSLLSVKCCNDQPNKQLREYSAYPDFFVGLLGIGKSGDLHLIQSDKEEEIFLIAGGCQKAISCHKYTECSYIWRIILGALCKVYTCTLQIDYSKISVLYHPFFSGIKL